MSVIKMQTMLPALTLESGTHLLSRCLALRLTVNTRMFYSPQQDTLWRKLSERRVASFHLVHHDLPWEKWRFMWDRQAEQRILWFYYFLFIYFFGQGSPLSSPPPNPPFFFLWTNNPDIIFSYSSNGVGWGCRGVTSGLIKLADLLLERRSLFKGAGSGGPEAHPLSGSSSDTAAAAAEPEPTPARWDSLHSAHFSKDGYKERGRFGWVCVCVRLSVRARFGHCSNSDDGKIKHIFSLILCFLSSSIFRCDRDDDDEGGEEEDEKEEEDARCSAPTELRISTGKWTHRSSTSPP